MDGDVNLHEIRYVLPTSLDPFKGVEEDGDIVQQRCNSLRYGRLHILEFHILFSGLGVPDRQCQYCGG